MSPQPDPHANEKAKSEQGAGHLALFIACVGIGAVAIAAVFAVVLMRK